MRIRYPEVVVRLSGTDGNAFAILAKVQKALSDGGVDHEEIFGEFYEQATACDYDNLIRTCMEWVTVE